MDTVSVLDFKLPSGSCNPELGSHFGSFRDSDQRKVVLIT